MKPYILAISAIVLLLLGYYFFSSDDKPELTYEQKIEDYRLEVAYFLRTSPSSPFANLKKSFTMPEYFPIDESYRVIADFEPTTTIKTIEIPTNDGTVKEYQLYGYVNFELKGEKQRLTLYSRMEGNTQDIFLGFWDPTNGESTYGGGRYLNIAHRGEEQIVLDFNKAYNPYCVYNESYICPIPPRTNKITLPVPVGEMDYPQNNENLSP